jgi:hypothetical protein
VAPGSVCLQLSWAAHFGGRIFIEPIQVTLYATGHLLRALAMLPVLVDLWRITCSGIDRFEGDEESTATEQEMEEAGFVDQVPNSA